MTFLPKSGGNPRRSRLVCTPSHALARPHSSSNHLFVAPISHSITSFVTPFCSLLLCSIDSLHRSLFHYLVYCSSIPSFFAPIVSPFLLPVSRSAIVSFSAPASPFMLASILLLFLVTRSLSIFRFNSVILILPPSLSFYRHRGLFDLFPYRSLPLRCCSFYCRRHFFFRFYSIAPIEMHSDVFVAWKCKDSIHSLKQAS